MVEISRSGKVDFLGLDVVELVRRSCKVEVLRLGVGTFVRLDILEVERVQGVLVVLCSVITS